MVQKVETLLFHPFPGSSANTVSTGDLYSGWFQSIPMLIEITLCIFINMFIFYLTFHTMGLKPLLILVLMSPLF